MQALHFTQLHHVTMLPASEGGELPTADRASSAPHIERRHTREGLLRLLACVQVWSGSVTGIAHKSLAVAADYLAGPADIAQLLGQQDVSPCGLTFSIRWMAGPLSAAIAVM